MVVYIVSVKNLKVENIMKETKYITLLDFEISRIFQYKISADKKSDC